MGSIWLGCVNCQKIPCSPNFCHTPPSSPQEPLAIEDIEGSLREWISQERPRREIKRRFRDFLRTYVEAGVGDSEYKQRILEMCSSNRQSLEVSYIHLVRSEPQIALWTIDAPLEILEIFDEVLCEHVEALYPHCESLIA